jgi:hypothetical protein
VEGAEEALRVLGENVDGEWLVMLPCQEQAQNKVGDGIGGGGEKGETQYRLEAFVNCFPSGFNTRAKLGMLLDEIHGPVPGYKDK